jgi:hypothetical protein
LFGAANGMDSLAQMRRSVSRYRKQPLDPGEDPIIGCVFVRDIRFFPAEATAEPPPGFASNIVQGKGYDLAEGGGGECLRTSVRHHRRQDPANPSSSTHPTASGRRTPDR